MFKQFILLCIILILLFYIFYIPKKKIESPLQSIPENYKEDIPHNLFQTWSSKNLPPKMKEVVEYNMIMNPEITFYLYDDNDCRDFIKANFDSSVLDAFDCLKPGAYKADLWRYCVLYKYGGVYMDIKFKCLRKLKDIMTGNFVVMDRPEWFRSIGIYNAFMIFNKEHPFLLKAIEKTVSNVQKRKYGYNDLYPTGPGMLGDLFMKNRSIAPMIVMKNETINNSAKMKIIYDQKPILIEYDEYRKDMGSTSSIRYGKLWATKNIYNKK